jgi:hypothetical protein
MVNRVERGKAAFREETPDFVVGGTVFSHCPYYGAHYPAYHPPVTVNNYGSGCYNCGGWSTAGAAATGVASWPGLP